MDPDYNDIGESNVHGALIFQGGGSLDAYEAGAYKAISEEMSTFIKKAIEKRKKKNRRYFIKFLEHQLVQLMPPSW
jgi:hypothetical protein